jgi:hypothetical protein
MKPHETILETSMSLNAIQSRPPRKLSVLHLVESIEVPYIIDETEYRRRLANRDASREAAQAETDKWRAARKAVK